MEKHKTFLIVIGALICLFNALDAVFTHHFIAVQAAEESNPIMFFILQNGGFLSFYFVKLLLGFIFLVGAFKVYQYAWARLGFVFVLVIYIFINIKYHFWGIYFLYFS